LRESLDNLLHGCSVIRAVGEDNIDVWLLESLEGALESFADVLLGETAGVGLREMISTDAQVVADESSHTSLRPVPKKTLVVRTIEE